MLDDENDENDELWEYEPDLGPVVQAAIDVINAIQYAIFNDPPEGEVHEDDEVFGEIIENFFAPVCGCDVCCAREIIHVTFPLCVNAALKAMVKHNENPEAAPCCIVAGRAWNYHHALLDISVGVDDPKARAQEALGMKQGEA